MKLLNAKELYDTFEYPESFQKVVELNLIDYDLWYLMSNEQVLTRIEGLKNRYPNRKLIPFARRDDSDDIACFEIGKADKVEIIHDFTGVGYEQRKEFETFWDWFKSAIDEMVEYNE
ncbi:hypothetical protein HPL003_12165 [Paenibacillus terrae HPL-003]|uniref:SMI1/KNR4 family protein n=1 Tax=Paenibacillus terrae (strain HPL-003) TaxID=985665 RepID=G7W210_PAETH|nr:hypothetical protein [Paenibacillus terrae]AET59190.1 hypothetical protein HPL003_12165 [Paenibacillus terrae HPL-003]